MPPALVAPRVVVRVRPLAAEGGHSASGRRVYKRLAKWDEGEVVLDENVDLDRLGASNAVAPRASVSGEQAADFTIGAGASAAKIAVKPGSSSRSRRASAPTASATGATAGGASGASKAGKPAPAAELQADTTAIGLAAERKIVQPPKSALTRPQCYSFMKDILDTDASQEEVYASSAGNLVRRMCEEDFSALLFAYGQTGTGKTHSIFGAEASWSDMRHVEAGIFPRAVLDIFATVGRQQKEGGGDVEKKFKWALSAAACEFYMCQCTDLLDDNAPVLIGADYQPTGLKHFPLGSEADCLEFMATVRANRTARATLMNKACGGHTGSSRSHCSMILTLRKLAARGDCVKTQLHIMDMAGAERPSSTGNDQDRGIQAVMDYFRGVAPDISTGGQGFIVNFELSGLRTAVVFAREQHRARKKLCIPRGVGSSFIAYASGCFTGQALLGMLVTLSPAPQCGWETWFSCTYGEDLAKLCVPVKPNSWKSFETVLRAAEKSAAESEQKLAKTPAAGPAAKYHVPRQVQLKHDMGELELWKQLGA